MNKIILYVSISSSNGKNPLYCYCVRNFQTSICTLKNLNAIKQGTMMNKFFNRSTPKRKWYDSTPPVMETPKSLTASKGEPGKNSKLRCSVLNKLFMKHITDQMVSGSVSPLLIGRGIEVSQVNVAQDFNAVNVYWLTKGSEEDTETENILQEAAFALRHELSQLKIVGVVPRINFVRDRQYARIKEIDVQLSKADFGEDFVPHDSTFNMKTELVLNSKLDTNIMDQIKSMDNTSNVEEVNLPPMRNDIYGLDHSRMMGRIMQAVNKSKVAWSNAEYAAMSVKQATETGTPSVPSDAVQLTAREQKIKFAEFLKKRQLLQKKHKEDLQLNNVIVTFYDDDADDDTDKYEPDLEDSKDAGYLFEEEQYDKI